MVFGLLIMTMFLSAFNFQTVYAAADEEVEVGDDDIQDQVQANERVRFRFRQRTQITVQSNVNTSVNINCKARDIGDKDFEIELEGEGDLEMNMTCTEEEKELGLQKGNTYQTRNRNRYRYQEGFCTQIECNESCEAKLKLEATEENQNGQWAYYDDDDEEWVTVETTLEDGYLVAETDHFSTWTVLLPEIDYVLIIGITVGVGAIVIAALVIIFMKKRK